MKYVQINSVPHGSTGSVMKTIHEKRIAAGDESWMMWGRGREAENDHEFNFGSKVGFYLDVLQTRVDGRAGFHSKVATRWLLTKLDEIDPDIVHLHNLHGYYINVELLFKWLADHRCRVKWTLHDCWAFTGHCAHFTYAKCAQWQSHCAYDEPCCQRFAYPMTYSKSACAKNFDDKKHVFNLIPRERMRLISPSQWLADLLASSFLSAYSVCVNHNEVNHSVFKSTPSSFCENFGLESKFVVLGVASPWTDRKGLDDFMKLREELDESYAIVLIGLSEKQIARMPKGLIGLPKTESMSELAAAYTAADVLFYPTKEDNFPTVLLEAQACSTPVITYDVGGCKETLTLMESQAVRNRSEARTCLEDLRTKKRTLLYA